MIWVLALVVVLIGHPVVHAEAQSVYVPRGGKVIEVPLGALPVTAGTALPAPAEGGMVRVDGLPNGAMVVVDGRPLGGPAELGGGWIVLAPGPHFFDVALPGGNIRFTVVTPVEGSGYQVVPKP
jgi:hypothetical protein